MARPLVRSRGGNNSLIKDLAPYGSALGDLGSDWTNKAKFAAPIGILGDLAAHKRLPARCAM